MSFPRRARGRLTLAIVGSTFGWLLALALSEPLSAQSLPPPAEAWPPGTAAVGVAPAAGGASSSSAAATSAPVSPVTPAASQAPQTQVGSPAANGARSPIIGAPVAPSSSAAMPRLPASSHAGVRNAGSALTKPLWRELSPAQQQALLPLSGKWDTLNEAQKRKWLALSRNFGRLAPPEQQKLHSRMTEWAALTQQQRAQARFNYGETRKLSVEDKKAKWEAYQALSAEEKKKLATGAAKAPATAAAVRPLPGQKIATLPRSKASQPTGMPPRIATQRVDQHTLLPQPAPTAPTHSVD